MHARLMLIASSLVAGLAAAAPADTSSAMAAAKAKYEKDRAYCLSGQSQQDQATCLKEAGAAYDEAKRGGLTNDGKLKANARQRCDGLPEADKADCLKRVAGEGTTTEGSVRGGGVLKETVTRTVIPASAPAASDAAR